MSPPHVLIFPVPLQGHVNSMLNLAEILCLSGLHVTILLSDYTHNRLLRHASLQSRFSRHSGFRVATISDGLPADHPRVGERIVDIVLSLKEVGGPQFRHLMESTDGLSDGGARRRVSCLIMDGVFSFAIPVLEEMGIPYIYFRTISACSFWPYFCLQEIIDAGEVPLIAKDEDKLTYWNKKEMDMMVTSVPGMERILRLRDIPRFCRVEDVNHPGLQTMKIETRRTADASGLILNTFEDLEGPILDEIRKHIPNLYSLCDICELWKCYNIDKDELLEFWYGLVNSGYRFLWVIRPDSILGNDTGNENEIPMELEEGTKSRGYMVGWVPQQQVLAIQQSITNSRFVSEVWKVGLDIKDTCDRIIVEKMVKEVMDVRRDEFLERAHSMASLARKAISEGGSSYLNLNRLVEFLNSTVS
ncbi:UNVERIFIED_CONTAM: 7-deoxyloganetic acid glucosyl transferase [Sesamum angustifolium]|uniref:7-deoxyloganetic acid glucosyl transferase n=1 Tax=Sesamum angustifolium TaxID=2727405 RepID=A0AAW2PV34_9LAMI